MEEKAEGQEESDDILERVRRLHGVTWMWDDSEEVRSRGLTPGERGSGVLAQDVEAAFPHLVARDEEGFLSVDYDGLVGVLIEATKRLDERLSALEAHMEGSERPG